MKTLPTVILSIALIISSLCISIGLMSNRYRFEGHYGFTTVYDKLTGKIYLHAYVTEPGTNKVSGILVANKDPIHEKENWKNMSLPKEPPYGFEKLKQ